jgi:hypothetical protein
MIYRLFSYFYKHTAYSAYFLITLAKKAPHHLPIVHST